jgi:hypothetical protein
MTSLLNGRRAVGGDQDSTSKSWNDVICRSLKLSALTMVTDPRRFASRGPSGVPSKLSRRASVWMFHEAATAL